MSQVYFVFVFVFAAGGGLVHRLPVWGAFIESQCICTSVPTLSWGQYRLASKQDTNTNTNSKKYTVTQVKPATSGKHSLHISSFSQETHVYFKRRHRRRAGVAGTSACSAIASTDRRSWVTFLSARPRASARTDKLHATQKMLHECGQPCHGNNETYGTDGPTTNAFLKKLETVHYV